MRSLQFIVCSLVFFLSISSPALAQIPQAEPSDALLAKIMNGMNAVMKPSPGASATELELYIKTGSVYESDSLSGINSMIDYLLGKRVETALRKGSNGISTSNTSNTSFSTFSTSEHTVFHFTCSEANVPACLNLIRDNIFPVAITKQELDSAIANAYRQIEIHRSDYRKVFEEKLLREVFRQDFDKMNPNGNPAKFKNINLNTANVFFHRYYVPNNSILIITGKFDIDTFRDQFNKAFSSLPKSEFDPETITKIIDFRPMVYNNQVVVTDNAVSVPEFQICWQFPGTYSYQEGSYYAYLLSAMLNDKNNYLNVIAAKMGCRKLSFQYEANEFSGILKVVLVPDKNLLVPTYHWLMDQMAKLNQTLVNESMINAGKVIFKQEYLKLRSSKEYPSWIAKNWPYSDNTYFPTLLDSVMNTGEKGMQRFVAEYLMENAHVSGLLISEADRTALNVDSSFTEVSDSVANYTFTYRSNITDLEGADNQTKLRNLLQWLKANTDVSIKINGFSDVGEFNKAFDDTLIRYIDSIPTFRKTMPDLIAKGYLRPEMMRSLKLIKYLNDNGIEQSRLSGTSMPLHSSNKKEEEENMKCTIILSKARKMVSLHEYHYHKKSEN